MIFQGKELHIGDKLVSKRHGVIEVEALHRTFFKSSVGRVIYDWDYEGRYCYVGDNIIDASWPDVSTEQTPSPSQALHDRMIDFMDSCKPPAPDVQREAEYRRIWIEMAMKIFDSSYNDNSDNIYEAVGAFDAADAFLAELKRRDGEGL